MGPTAAAPSANNSRPFLSALAIPGLAAGQTGGLVKLTLFLWTLEILILYSRLFDVWGYGLHLPLASLWVLCMVFVFSGRLFAGLKTAGGRIMVAFVAWVALTIPFSIWKSASIPGLQGLVESLLFFLVAAGVGTAVKSIRQMMYAFALSSLMTALLSIPFGESREGRLSLFQGSYADANEYAMGLLVGIPCWWLMTVMTRSKVVKALGLLCTVPILWAFAKTGSRGGLIALGVVMVVLFLQANFSKKILLLAATVAGLVAAGAFMPGYIKARYLTYFTSNSGSEGVDAEQLKSDVNSAEGRRILFFKSVEITLTHPLFGVGPGNFPLEVFDDAKQNGESYAWLVTHNSYTQISSETGIPGLILFVALVLYAFRGLSVVLKISGTEGISPGPETYLTAKYLRLSVLVVAVCMIFLSVGYSPLIYILVGIVAGFHRLVSEQARQQALAPARPVPPVDPAGSLLPAVIKPPKALPAPKPTGKQANVERPARQLTGAGIRGVRFNRLK